MAISYSVENEASATECTEAEVKKKPENEQKILNDDDATKAAEKTQEDANPDKDDKPDLSESVYEIDEGVKEVVGIAAAATAAIAAVGTFAINKATHKGATATKKTLKYVVGGMDKLRTKQLKSIESILRSSKDFSVKPADFEFSKKYAAENRATVAEVKKLLDELRSKYIVNSDDAKLAVSANYSSDELKEMVAETREIEEYTKKLNALEEKLDAGKPPKSDASTAKNISKTELLSVYREIEKEISDGAASAKSYLEAFDAANYSEVVGTSTTGSNTYSFSMSSGISLDSYTSSKTEVRKTPNSVFVNKANALAEAYNVANLCYQHYVWNALYYLKTSTNTLLSGRHLSEDATPEDKLTLAKALVEEVQCEQEFTKLLEEGAVEMCLDEDYVKKELRKEAILNGKLMKEAKAHSKAAKKAVKASDIDKAIEEQEAYVNILKQLLEECNDIKDDSKMVLVTNAVITGLLAGLASMMIGINPVVWHAGKRFAPKLAAGDMDFNSEEDAEAAYGAIKKHFGDKVGKIELAANTVVGIVAAIVAGKLKYDKQILKYGADVGKGFKLGVPKSRIEAQQRLRRMVRLAEQLLREYKDIKRIESKG